MLTFKDELAGTPIEEFCALKPKIYSLVAGGYGKRSAKGTKIFAHSKLHHDMFKKTLATGDLVMPKIFKIASKKHQLHTVCVNKIALSAYDDTRYINRDRTTTLSFGQFSLRDEYLTKKICEHSDCAVDSHEDINAFNIPNGRSILMGNPGSGIQSTLILE